MAWASVRPSLVANSTAAPGPLSLPGAQRLPVPGKVEVGDRELELQPADGHTEDGMAVWIPWARILVAGDYLSPVEIPMLSESGSLSAYLATLDRLEPLVEQADHVVPGHGEPIDGTRAAAILREDRAYLQALQTRVAEIKREGKTVEQTADTVTAEFRAKYPNWTGSAAAAARVAYGEAK